MYMEIVNFNDCMLGDDDKCILYKLSYSFNIDMQHQHLDNVTAKHRSPSVHNIKT